MAVLSRVCYFSPLDIGIGTGRQTQLRRASRALRLHRSGDNSIVILNMVHEDKVIKIKTQRSLKDTVPPNRVSPSQITREGMMHVGGLFRTNTHRPQIQKLTTSYCTLLIPAYISCILCNVSIPTVRVTLYFPSYRDFASAIQQFIRGELFEPFLTECLIPSI